MAISDALSHREPSVLIVGAGMAGLMAAAALPALRHRLCVVDMGRSAGGRLATGRVGSGRGDQGAQFFTARTPVFADWVNRWERSGLVYRWADGWSDGSLSAVEHDGHPRYAVRDGMQALARNLAQAVAAQGAVVHTGVRIQAISRADQRWWACSDDGRVYTASALVLALPAPQALALLAEGGVTLHAADAARLARIAYAPCLCALLRFGGEVALPAPGGIQRPSAAVPWLADNRRKGISPHATVLTAHAGPELSRALLDADDATVAAALLAGIAPLLGSAGAPDEVQIKRWRYALPTTLDADPFVCAQGLPPLYFCGDAFGSPRVEGAALSGLAVAAALRTRHALEAAPGPVLAHNG